MAKETKEAAGEAPEAAKPAVTAFMFRVKRKPQKRGEPKAMDVAPMAKGMAFRNGEVYTELVQVKPLSGGITGSETVKTQLTPKLCEQLKAIMEKSWSGPSFQHGLEVSFAPMAA